MRWGVFKVFDSGRASELIGPSPSAEAADRVAGYMRDHMTDADVGAALKAGWNYLPRPLTREQAMKARAREQAARRSSPQRHAPQRIATPPKRLVRKGVGRRT